MPPVKFLVDANVLSEPTKAIPAPRVLDWLKSNHRFLAINPIILGELEHGVLLLSAGKKRRQLDHWLSDVVRKLLVIDIDGSTAQIWAHLLTELKRQGCAMPVKDSLIAATALQYGLTIATRNTHDYRFAGAKLVDPFSDALQ